MAKPIIDVTKDKATTPTQDTASGADVFAKQLQEKMLGQSDIVSSMDTNIESTFQKAIAGQQQAADANTARVTSEYNRAQEYTRQTGDIATATELESRRGFATSRTALITLESETQKNLKDLEQRKQELILAGESAAASKISELQTSKLKFQSDAQQQYFANLLGMANYTQGQQTLAQNASQFTAQQGLAEKQFAWSQTTADRDYAIAKAQFIEGNRQFEKNYGFNLLKFDADEKQRGADNARADKQLDLAWADYGLKKSLTDAQIKEINYKITSQVNADGVTLPKTGQGGEDIKFVPRNNLTAAQQAQVASTIEGVDLINRAEALYRAAVASETPGLSDKLALSVLGEGAYATSFLGNKRAAGAFFGTSPAWKDYKDFLVSNKAGIAKGIGGESGNLAAQEQVDALLKLDATASTPKSASLKFEQAKGIMRTRLSNLGTVSSAAAQTDPYSSFRSQLQTGEILVNRGGQAVAITEAEMQPSDIKL